MSCIYIILYKSASTHIHTPVRDFARCHHLIRRHSHSHTFTRQRQYWEQVSISCCTCWGSNHHPCNHWNDHFCATAKCRHPNVRVNSDRGTINSTMSPLILMYPPLFSPFTKHFKNVKNGAPVHVICRMSHYTQYCTLLGQDVFF